MKRPAAISTANSVTNGKKLYSEAPSLSSACIGLTHLHGVPGGVVVNGSMHVIDKQSEN
ncbi:hypothetical protein Hanom_Chr10g00965731 [Helianthus anomalus]